MASIRSSRVNERAAERANGRSRFHSGETVIAIDADRKKGSVALIEWLENMKICSCDGTRVCRVRVCRVPRHACARPMPRSDIILSGRVDT